MNNRYTLEDIEKFIIDYKNSLVIGPKDWMVSIPVFGRKIYQRAALEQQKWKIFENHLMEAKNGSIEEQKKFIEQMTPVLDNFYSNSKENTGTKRK